MKGFIITVKDGKWVEFDSDVQLRIISTNMEGNVIKWEWNRSNDVSSCYSLSKPFHVFKTALLFELRFAVVC